MKVRIFALVAAAACVGGGLAPAGARVASSPNAARLCGGESASVSLVLGYSVSPLNPVERHYPPVGADGRIGYSEILCQYVADATLVSPRTVILVNETLSRSPTASALKLFLAEQLTYDGVPIKMVRHSSLGGATYYGWVYEKRDGLACEVLVTTSGRKMAVAMIYAKAASSKLPALLKVAANL